MTNNSFPWPTIEKEFQRAERVLILNPKDSDGDSIGAGLALWHYCAMLGKKALMFTAKAPSDQLSYLPGFEHISHDFKDLDPWQFDLAVSVDFADLKMLDFSDPLLERLRATPFINIDHHPTNHLFGTINVVEPTAAAACELLFMFFEEQGIRYTSDVATCLLAGIIYDTGSFAHLNTTRSVVEVSAQLLSRGARMKEITNHARNKSLPTLKLWGVALSRLQTHPRTGISTTIISQEDLKESNADDEATEGIANFLNSLSGAKAVLVLKESADGKIKGSLRSTMPGVDVSKLAMALGGGGHKKAAGFTIPGRLKHRGSRWQLV